MKTPLEGSKVCSEGPLLDIFVIDFNLMKLTGNVDLKDDRGAPQLSQYGLDGW